MNDKIMTWVLHRITGEFGRGLLIEGYRRVEVTLSTLTLAAKNGVAFEDLHRVVVKRGPLVTTDDIASRSNLACEQWPWWEATQLIMMNTSPDARGMIDGESMTVHEILRMLADDDIFLEGEEGCPFCHDANHVSTVEVGWFRCSTCDMMWGTDEPELDEAPAPDVHAPVEGILKKSVPAKETQCTLTYHDGWALCSHCKHEWVEYPREIDDCKYCPRCGARVITNEHAKGVAALFPDTSQEELVEAAESGYREGVRAAPYLIPPGIRDAHKADRMRSVSEEPLVCPGCGAKEGDHHTINCDVVRCPLCGYQRLDCECNYVSVRYNGETVTELFQPDRSHKAHEERSLWVRGVSTLCSACVQEKKGPLNGKTYTLLQPVLAHDKCDECGYVPGRTKEPDGAWVTMEEMSELLCLAAQVGVEETLAKVREGIYARAATLK